MLRLAPLCACLRKMCDWGREGTCCCCFQPVNADPWRAHMHRLYRSALAQGERGPKSCTEVLAALGTAAETMSWNSCLHWRRSHAGWDSFEKYLGWLQFGRRRRKACWFCWMHREYQAAFHNIVQPCDATKNLFSWFSLNPCITKLRFALPVIVVICLSSPTCDDPRLEMSLGPTWCSVVHADHHSQADSHIPPGGNGHEGRIQTRVRPEERERSPPQRCANNVLRHTANW